jgi:cytoskeletal protein RodZ
MAVASFGEKLRKEREQRGITLNDVSSTTKITTRMLRAIEDEHFDQLPGGVFNKGFIRAYARHIGLDEDQVIADYLAATGQPLIGNREDPVSVDQAADKAALEERLRSLNDGDATRIPWVFLALVLLLAALVFAVWHFRKHAAGNQRPKVVAALTLLASRQPMHLQ